MNVTTPKQASSIKAPKNKDYDYQSSGLVAAWKRPEFQPPRIEKPNIFPEPE